MQEYNAPTDSAGQAATANSLRPYAGQSDADCARWMLNWLNAQGHMDTGKAQGAYCHELYKTRPEGYLEEPEVAAWYEALTEKQRRIMSNRRNDPAKVAAKNAKKAAQSAKVKADPAYRLQNAEKREAYATKIEIEENREVREYRDLSGLTAEQRAADRRARNAEYQSKRRAKKRAAKEALLSDPAHQKRLQATLESLKAAEAAELGQQAGE